MLYVAALLKFMITQHSHSLVELKALRKAFVVLMLVVQNGGFFLACEDFGRMFDNLIHACALF